MTLGLEELDLFQKNPLHGVERPKSANSIPYPSIVNPLHGVESL